MRVLVCVKASPESEAGEMGPPEMFEEMGRYNEQLANAGVLLAADGLQPSSKGKRVRFDGDQKTVIDGPFAETKELIAGFWIWQVRSIDEAVEWLKRAPFGGGAEVEIRPIMEFEELGDVLSQEARESQSRVFDAVNRQQQR
jgi:hypothetical protein